jgi:primary-amine oxidase
VAGPLSPTFSAPDFAPLKRAQYALHPFWVTKFRDTERFAAGDYPYQADPGVNPAAGLPTFIADGESVEGQDLVVWHTIGFTHHPEPEEYPVMPVETLGFKLRPDNFFDMNPALDLPK